MERNQAIAIKYGIEEFQLWLSHSVIPKKSNVILAKMSIPQKQQRIGPILTQEKHISTYNASAFTQVTTSQAATHSMKLWKRFRFKSMDLRDKCYPE